MSNPLVNHQLLTNLNRLHQIPFPIVKLIVDGIYHALNNHQNALEIKTIQKILKQQQIQANGWEKGASSLSYLIKFCSKHEMPQKFIFSFLGENTILSEQTIQYIFDGYDSYLKQSQMVPKRSEFSDCCWSIYNMQKDKEKRSINAMYVKIKLTTIEDAHLKHSHFISQLPQFKALTEEVLKVENILSN